MRLGTKIALLMSALVVIVLTALGVVDAAKDEAYLEADTTRDHAVLANVLAASVEREMQRGISDDEVSQFVRAAVHRDGELQVRWGWMADTDHPALDGAPADVWPRVAAGKHVTFRRAVPAEQWSLVAGNGPGRRAFYVAVGESLVGERRHLAATEIRTAATIVLLAILCSGVIMLVGRRFVTRPVEGLVAYARAVASGRLGEPLLLHQRDEIGQLAREMNEMSAQLGASRERLELETQRRVATVEQLRHADRLTTVGKLSSGLAHELGTPLNVVQGYGRLIADREGVDEEVRAQAETIVGQTDKMTRLVRQLLGFARRKGPRKENVDVGTLVEKVITVLAPSARKKGVRLETKLEPEAVVAADATMIEQVVTNLVFNALQASADGAQPIVVDVRRVDDVPEHPTASGAFVRIDVRDHGRGISDEHLPRIFEPFFTTKEVGEGTGLGLSVSYGIVQDHGGYIAVESSLGMGTTFHVYLPTTSDAEARAAGEGKPGERPATPDGQRQQVSLAHHGVPTLS